MVPVELSRIVISDVRNDQMIWLKEINGTREFPIIISIFEAAAIDRKIKEFVPPRPMTHDLFANVIESLNGRLEKVEVTEIKKNTFYAQLVISHNGSSVIIDSRPSDAIALAVRCNAPIFVAEEVLEEVCQ